MNILVTGANGQLGQAFKKVGFSALDEVFYTDVEELDVTDLGAVEEFVQANEIDTIVNCAAYTAVDRAEEEPEAAMRINRNAVANLAEVAAKEACLLLHVSTDYVFDGSAAEPYTERSPVNPQGVYGKTKLAGERAIKTSGCLAIVVRTAWLYSEFGHNFVKTIRKAAREKGELNVVADQMGAPTYAVDLARAVVRILDSADVADHTGIYHYSNEGVCSWYDFAVEIVRQSGIACRIHPVTTDQYPVKAKRPAYSVLDKAKVRKTFGVEVPEWREALSRCLQEMEG